MERPPKNLLLARHGRADGNEMRSLLEAGREDLLTDALLARNMEDHPLTRLGENQADRTGNYLAQCILRFGHIAIDHYITSPHVRTRQTAGHIGKSIEAYFDERQKIGVKNPITSPIVWEVDRRLREQQWTGNLDRSAPPDRTSPLYSLRNHVESRIDTAERYRLFLESRKQQLAGKTALLVVHGHLMAAAQVVHECEGMPDSEAWEVSEARSIANCNIIHYTSEEPETGEQTDRIRWVRAIVPHEFRGGSNFGWREIEYPKVYSSDDLLAQTAQYERLIAEEHCGLEPIGASQDALLS